MKLLLVRLDKIGDLVSTLPVDEIFSGAHTAAGKPVEVEWVISKGLGFLAEYAEPPRLAHEISLSPRGRVEFRQLLRQLSPEMVVIFYAPWWAYFEVWWHRIQLRVGRYSRWFSFLFLNKGLRQSRSRSEKHEAEYNLELAQLARRLLLQDQPVKTAVSAPVLHLKAPLLRQVFEKLLIRPQEYIVIHPGMAGSALNWPPEHYQNLIEEFLKQDSKTQVVITGTHIDQPWTEPLLRHFKNEKRVISAVDTVNLLELLFLLSKARAVVVPSTGVAHLAASLGTPTLALYSPVKAHSSKRWGPRGEQVRIFEVPASTGTSVSSVNPMVQITPKELLRHLVENPV